MERSGQFKAKLNDLTLAHMDERSDDFDVSLPSSSADKLLKRLIIRGTAVGIAGTVLLDGPNQHLFRPQHLGPADSGGEEVSVTKWNVGDRNRLANRFCFRSIRYSDRGVGQRRASDLAEDVDPEMQELGEMQRLGYGAGALQLAPLSTLAVAEVKSVSLIVAGRESGTDGRVHSPGKAHYRARAGHLGNRTHNTL